MVAVIVPVALYTMSESHALFLYDIPTHIAAF